MNPRVLDGRSGIRHVGWSRYERVVPSGTLDIRRQPKASLAAQGPALAPPAGEGATVAYIIAIVCKADYGKPTTSRLFLISRPFPSPLDEGNSYSQNDLRMVRTLYSIFCSDGGSSTSFS